MKTGIASCPRCSAKTENEAESMCQPGDDECPMLFSDDWDEALKHIQERIKSDEQYAAFFNGVVKS